MSSRRKASNKSRRDCFVSGSSSSQFNNDMLKVEFEIPSVDPEDEERYWEANGGTKLPRPGILEFRLPEAEEVARSPPEDYFACFEAYLMQCHLSFPIPEVIAKLLSGFRLSIGQIYPCGLQHIVGILVLSYELGVTLDVSHLEAMLRPSGTSTMVQLKPHPTMAIITEFYSNYHGWKDHFSLSESMMHPWRRVVFPSFGPCGVRKVLPTEHQFGFDDTRPYDFFFFFAVSKPFPPIPDGLIAIKDLFRGEKFFWATFTLKGVRRAVALYRSRNEPDLLIDEESGSSMDGFVPCKDRKEKGQSKIRKDKIIVVADVAADGQDFPGDVLRDYLNSGEPDDLDELFDFKLPPSDDGSNEVPEFSEALRKVNGALLNISRALGASIQEALMDQFKAKMADKEIARLKGEWERSRCREWGSFEADTRRAYTRGRKDVAEIVRTRHERFSYEFGELKASHKALREYCECRGTASGLYLMTAHDYSYDVEYVRQSRRMNERNRDFSIPQIEQRIWEQWDLIPISHEMVEAETGVPDETSDVDQPAPLDANDQSFRGSMTGFFDLGTDRKIFRDLSG
ncbi:hypothetical protein Bca4012_037589 [Brassica carinata]